MAEWQPIETAPTTGHIPILLWREGMDIPQEAFADTWWVGGFFSGNEADPLETKTRPAATREAKGRWKLRIESLKFEQREEGAFPSEVTVTMSITEAAQIATLCGEMSDKAMTDRGWPVTHIYTDLTANVFNRYWEDGLVGMMRGDSE